MTHVKKQIQNLKQWAEKKTGGGYSCVPSKLAIYQTEWALLSVGLTKEKKLTIYDEQSINENVSVKTKTYNLQFALVDLKNCTDVTCLPLNPCTGKNKKNLRKNHKIRTDFF